MRHYEFLLHGRDLITHICQAIEQAQKNGYLQEEKEDWNGGY